jgi:hypothetical protein
MKTKVCRTCKEELPLASFKKYKDKRVDKVYYKTDCSTCHNKICRERHLSERYNITIAEYDERLQKQGNCCAICKGTDTKSAGRFVVDHNHATGEVRGLLCQTCNAMLGQAQDNVLILQAGINYLNNTSNYSHLRVSGDTTIIGGDDDSIIDGDYEDVE